MGLNPFEYTVKEALGSWPRGTLFLSAVSGGADSTAMLAALIALRGETGFRFRVLHVDHRIRPYEESRSDAQAVIDLCKKFKVSCRVISIRTGRISRAKAEWGLGMGAAARVFRHRSWNKEANRIGAVRILVAHTRDDLLETCLIRILRGSGPAGLAQMPKERGRILRPLLNLSRNDVLSYLEEKGIPFRNDSSNADIHYLRNRIRHKLIPGLDNYFPYWKSSLTGLAETQTLAAAFISTEACKRLFWKKNGNDFWLEANTFFKEPLIIQEEAIFIAADTLSPGMLKSIPRRKKLRIVLNALKQGSTKAADLGPIRIFIQKDKIITRSTFKNDFEKGFSLLIDAPGFYYLDETNDSKITLRIKAEIMTENLTRRNGFLSSLPIVFRPWRKKDLIVKAGHRPCLSDILKGESKGEYSGFITAEDRIGIAAFICFGEKKDVLLLTRDDDPLQAKYRISVEK